MKCPSCQFDNREGAKFCKKCGLKLELKCPSCGYTCQSDSIFCDECGHDLKESQKTSPVNYEEPKSYTPKFLAEKILTTRSSIEGERKLVTVFFADVANYTNLSEKLDPEEVHQIMDGAFKILMDEIHRFEGTINQFTGDGVMALFGAPVAHEDHAQRACYAALSVQNTINAYGQKIKADCGLEFVMRVGLNSGSVIVGSIGDDLRMDYTAIGDTTNLAARMENLAEPGTVLLSKNTYKLTRDYFEFNQLGKLQVKGKEEPEEAYELIKPSKIETRIHASVAKGLTRFVGRKNSMAALMEPYEKAKSGSGQIVGIVGEAGVGKSRLILEFRNRLSEEKHTWLEGRCLHFGGSMVYLPILDILRSYFDIVEGDREAIIKKKLREAVLGLDENLGAAIPPFQELLSLTVDDEAFIALEPQQKRERTFEALRDLFIRESQNKTLILVIEDLHWIDNTTQDFINYLIDWLGNTNILLIALYRPEYIHQWGSKSHYSKIGLDQLGTESSSVLVRAILQGGDVVPELKELVLNKAAGNPLFMEEFTHTLLENGSIQKENGRYIMAKGTEDIQVPDTIQGIIAARMDRLEDNLKRTMQVASVIGRDFAFRILQTITGMREDLKSCLLNLQGLEFIYEKNLFPELEYIFKHALIQEVAYSSLLQARRKELHENIGKAIETIYASRLEEFYEMLAYHYSKSKNHQKASWYLIVSAEKAWESYSYQESYGFYLQAIEKLYLLPDTEETKRAQIAVRLLIANPMRLMAFPEHSLEILQDGERLSKELKDEKSLVKFYGFVSSYYTFKGDPIKSKKYTEDAFKKARKMQDIDMMAPLAAGLFPSYLIYGEFTKIAEAAPDAIALLEKTGRKFEYFDLPMNLYAYWCSFCGYSMSFLGNFKEGKIFLDKGLDYAIEINDLLNIAAGGIFYSGHYAMKGNGKHVIKHCQNSIKFFEEINFPQFLYFNWTYSGYGYYLLDDLEVAQKHIEKGLKIANDSQLTMGLGHSYYYLSLIHYDSGNLTKAQSCVEKAIELSKKNNEKQIEGISTFALGRILGKTDPLLVDKAEKYILQGMKTVKELKLKPYLARAYFCLGELYANVGRKEEALKSLNKAMTMCKEMEIDFWPDKIQEVLDRL